VATVKRIFRYLKGTTHLGLRFKRGTDATLQGYVDADWAGCADTRKSTSGYVFMLAGAAVSWRSKRQSTVALSSTEAEYMSACLAAKEAIWLRELLKELTFDQTTPTIILSDNQSSLKLMTNPVFHDRTKHVSIQYHFTRECIVNGSLTFTFVGTNLQAADSLTKGVPEQKFVFCRDLFGLMPMQS